MESSFERRHWIWRSFRFCCIISPIFFISRQYSVPFEAHEKEAWLLVASRPPMLDIAIAGCGCGRAGIAIRSSLAHFMQSPLLTVSQQPVPLYRKHNLS